MNKKIMITMAIVAAAALSGCGTAGQTAASGIALLFAMPIEAASSDLYRSSTNGVVASPKQFEQWRSVSFLYVQEAP